ELDLVELVLADEAAHVLAVGACFRSEAGSERAVLHGEAVRVEDLAGMEVGERDLGGGDQEEVALAEAGLEEVALELRELSRAEEGLAAHEVRRPDLGVAPLLRVQVEHEGHERPLQAGQGT